MSDATAEKAGDKYVDKSVDTGKVEPEKVDKEPVKTEEPEKADADVQAVPVEKNAFETRIKELTDKVRSGKRLSEAQLFELRSENDRLKKELETRPEQQEPAKSLSDFDYDEDKYRSYLDERAATIAEKVATKAVSKVQAQSNDEQVERDFRARESAFESTVSDYEDVVYGEVNGVRKWAASPSMADEIRLSEIGPELSYHLAKNPEIASEISNLSPRETVRRMTLLEASVKSEKAKVGKAVSDAPPPPPKIPSGDAALEKGFYEGMSDAEYAKLRRKEIANR